MDTLKIHFRKGVSNMKKLFALLLLVCMCFSFSAVAEEKVVTLMIDNATSYSGI